MPGDRNKPIDGKIIIQFGELQAEGTLVGATIAKVKGMFSAQLPAGSPAFPAAISARISTMDPEAEAWKAVQAPEEGRMLFLKTDWGVQMFQCVSKVVPDDYVIRTEDIHLEFFTA